MSTEDQPAPVKNVAQSGMLGITCAARCGATDRVPSFEDKQEKDPAKRLKPVQVHPWICLACWRAGWRSDGPLPPDGRWRVYNEDGREVAA